MNPFISVIRETNQEKIKARKVYKTVKNIKAAIKEKNVVSTPLCAKRDKY